jgi:DNA-binding transcriptional regulator YiaG
MQNINTMRTNAKNIFQGRLTIGLDLGDRSSAYCVLNEAGEIVLEHKLATTPETMTSPAVGYIRTAYRLKSRFDRLREHGMLTRSEIARRCGISTNTVSDWQRKGQVVAHAVNGRNQFLFEDPGPHLPRVSPTHCLS